MRTKTKICLLFHIKFGNFSNVSANVFNKLNVCVCVLNIFYVIGNISHIINLENLQD